MLGHSVKVLCHSVKVDGGCHRRGLVAACRLLCALNLRSAERCSVERSLGCPDLYHCSVAIDSQTRNPSLPSPLPPHQSQTSPVAQVLFSSVPYTRVGRQSGLLQQLLTARSAVVGYVAQQPARPSAWGLWGLSVAPCDQFLLSELLGVTGAIVAHRSVELEEIYRDGQDSRRLGTLGKFTSDPQRLAALWKQQLTLAQIKRAPLVTCDKKGVSVDGNRTKH